VNGRLNLAALTRLPDAVRPPPLDPAGLTPGIVHLGIGAFHRAHQAVYTEDAMVAAGDAGWAVCGVTQRSATVRDQLAAQDGLYTVLERGAGSGPPRVVGVVRGVLSNVDAGAEVVRRLADPAVRVVTLTVTEKGYRRSATGRLNRADRAVRADIAGVGQPGYAPRTVVGQLVAGLHARWRSHGLGLSVVSCDNLPANGTAVAGLVTDFCAALAGRLGGRLGSWIAESVCFPSTLVDRIVPATTEADREEVARRLGLRDEAAVVAEPFSQWVIEDEFAVGRPRWEAAGALLTPNVAPYEAVKLRLLNGAHSLLAYAGALAGHDTIAAAVADPRLAGAARRLMDEDAAPTVTEPPGVSLTAYAASVLDRFANPALGHRTVQVASDGSQKLPIRLLATARDRLLGGGEPRWVAFAVAAWLLYVAQGVDRTGRPLPLDDPLAETLRDRLAGRVPAQSLVDSGLAVGEVFPPDLAGDDRFRDLLIDAVGEVRARCG
jgi:fructuronate reductase